MWWIVLAVLYIAFDLNYFIRAIFTVVVILCSKRGLKLTDTITTYGRFASTEGQFTRM